MLTLLELQVFHKQQFTCLLILKIKPYTSELTPAQHFCWLSKEREMESEPSQVSGVWLNEDV